MTTRFRFPPIAGQFGAIPFHSHWDATASAVRRYMNTRNTASGSVYSLALPETTASRQSKLWVQAHSDVLVAQTISGTVKGQIQCFESDAAMDAALQVHIRVVDPVAGTTRGVLWAPDKTFTAISASAGTENYEVATSRTNRKAPSGWSGSGHSLSSVDALDGDVIVVEIGLRHCNTVTTSYTGTINLGGVGWVSDLPEDETETALGTAWLEFSGNIAFTDVVVVEGETVIVPKVPVVYPEAPGAAIPTEGQLWPRGNRGV